MNRKIDEVKIHNMYLIKHGVLIMSDCVQALRIIPIDVKNLRVDYAALSTQIPYVSKVFGCLYAEISNPTETNIHGGYQGKGRRKGTGTGHIIAGFAKICQQVWNSQACSGQKQLLKEYIIKKLQNVKPYILIDSPCENYPNNIISVNFSGISSLKLMMILHYNGIAMSFGSACSNLFNKLSNVLKAIGLNDIAAEEALNISLVKKTNQRDIDYTVGVIRKYIQHT